MKPETKFRQNQVIPFLNTLQHTKYEPIQQVAIRGSADFVLCIWGRFVWLELKKDIDEVPMPLQVYKANEVIRAFGVAIVAHPQNWEEVKTKLLLMDSSKETAWKYR